MTGKIRIALLFIVAIIITSATTSAILAYRERTDNVKKFAQAPVQEVEIPEINPDEVPEVKYANSKIRLMSQVSFGGLQAWLVNKENNKPIETPCDISGGGYSQSGDVTASGYVPRGTIDSTPHGLCIYRNGDDNFRIINTNSLLKPGETIAQFIDSYTAYNYAIDTERKLFHIMVFKDMRNAPDGKPHINPYVRTISVSY